MVVSLRDIAQMIDHSLLHPTMTDAEIAAGCQIAVKHGVATVCVKPYSIPQVKPLLKGSSVLICAVVGFPHGNSMTSVKLRETQEALEAGAAEIDMVVNIGKVKSGAWDYVKAEIEFLQKACARKSAALKVIFENDFLTDAEIIKLCEICNDVRPAFVKTSSGYGFVKLPSGDYNYKGATEAQVRLMRQHCAAFIRIKAAGGIRTLDDLLKFRELGCTRIGATATEAIMEEAKKRGF
ncbi:MAG: deoxyribose-phosphate aldolase [Candidatus Omnitrophica bacterium]|nr:deoxyribose-phosphate aldolase [Candidatus Omnitrophota bacterium]